MAYIPKGQPGHDALFKIRPFFEPLIANFQAAYTPNREMSVDEAMIGFKGRLSFIQYLPNKLTFLLTAALVMCITGGSTQVYNNYIHMYMYMSLKHTCMYICAYMYMYIHVCTVYSCIHANIHACRVHAHTYNACTCIRTCISMITYMYISKS